MQNNATGNKVKFGFISGAVMLFGALASANTTATDTSYGSYVILGEGPSGDNIAIQGALAIRLSPALLSTPMKPVRLYQR